MLKHTQLVFIRATMILIFSSIMPGQTVPVPMDHPVNDFILRLYTQQKLHGLHPGSRPFTVGQVINALNEISTSDHSITNQEIILLERFKKEFGVDEIEQGIRGPWQSGNLSSSLQNIINVYDVDYPESRFVSYHDDQLLLWSDWEEHFSIDIQDTITRSFFTDRVTIAGVFDNNLSFYSRYTLHRVGHNENYPYPDEYKQGYALIDTNTNWLVWDVSEAVLHWENSVINVELSKIPIYWGFSKQHSPILSANVQPFTFFKASKTYKRIRTQSVLGSLVPFGEKPKGNVDIKYIAAHRFEFDLSSKLTVSFNEMIIYANRELELGYLLPINLFWSEEHGLGNRDNVLMSFDALWNVNPGMTFYGTFFWDELSWFKLFKPWWGNKFISQIGLYWVPFGDTRLPDFRIEFTASRPWVYTHQDTLLTYTSAENGLGFPLGPNSQLINLEINSWPTFKTHLSVNIAYVKKGTGLGSNPNHSYSLRNEDLDNDTPMLMGNVKENLIYGMNFHHRLTKLLSITGNCSFNNDEKIFEGRLGLLMNY